MPSDRPRGKRKERSRSRRKEERSRSDKRPPPTRRSRSRQKSGRVAARQSSPSASRSGSSSPRRKNTATQEEEVEGTTGVPLEARVALLEVENAKLKAENVELKKKLIELFRKPQTASSASKPGQAPERSERSPAANAGGGGAADRRRERLAAAANDPPSERRRHREEAATEPPKKSREEEEPSQQDEPMGPNAVMLVNGAMEAYNEPVPNNIPPEKRLPLVNQKMEAFMGHFADRIQVLDLKSGGPILKDKKFFAMRYMCVFRESGAKLKGTVNKRFYYDASGGKPTYCLDFETHERLVTATAGTPPDGKLGVRDPRTEHLITLYEEQNGKIVRMWLKQDQDKIGLKADAVEKDICQTEAFKAFEAKIKELRGGRLGEAVFHNYHDIPTVG